MPIMFFIHVQQNQLMLIMLFDCVQTTAADAHDAFHLYLNNIRIYIYICCTIYTCIYAHVFSRMYVTYTYIYVCVCVRIYVVCTYMYIYLAYVYMYMYVYDYKCLPVYTKVNSADADDAFICCAMNFADADDAFVCCF